MRSPGRWRGRSLPNSVRAPLPRKGNNRCLFQLVGETMYRVLDLDVSAVFVEAAANLHDAAGTIHYHQRRAGLLDVVEFAFEDRRGDLGHLQRVRPSHTATH